MREQLAMTQLSNDSQTAAKHKAFYQTAFVSGTRIDDVCERKEKRLKNVSSKVGELEKERDQLKSLNSKLLERVEVLQSIIDQQASANTYYYNYPPKPEEEPDKKTESATEKVRKIFEDQITTLKRKSERAYVDMCQSFTDQVEELQ